ncbi:zinc-finger homeodomain protein 9 [Dorcoceras hygrometricum]|uniref:Zinc-finger homeodomain protein 9 n=1 Tax=Dorcoceras hygrometricum TaxID=472368 RepID=A0A2Z7D7R1_9LAMI|nr:zinc-finger homeodomain protein 9 [Dorcoceras hygrometricum]
MDHQLSNSTPTNAAVPKAPEADTETPTRIQPTNKHSPFSNGVLKRHAPLSVHHAGGVAGGFGCHHPVVVSYKECLKNHAANLGGHAVDGCGEFMPSPASNPAEPTSLKCAACGCHRNFHRREPDDPPLVLPNATPALEYQPHHRHHPLPPVLASNRGNSSSSPNNSPSPPPISSSYYPSAPHMLLALSHGLSGPPPDCSQPIPISINASSTPLSSSPNGRKRFRTKFTQDQKGRMFEFAERICWKMQKKDEDLISEFCAETGIDRGVFKVWMHNNKNTLGKKDQPQQLTNNLTDKSPNTNGGIGYPSAVGTSAAASASTALHFHPHPHHHHHHHHHESNNDMKHSIHGQELSHTAAHVLGTNGSSSSS